MTFGEGQKTAIIRSLKIGRVDHYKDIMVTLDFNMNGTGCNLSFTMDEIKKMMEDVKVYEDVFSLVGLPCEIEVDDKNTCHFKGMWKE